MILCGDLYFGQEMLSGDVGLGWMHDFVRDGYCGFGCGILIGKDDYGDDGFYWGYLQVRIRIKIRIGVVCEMKVLTMHACKGDSMMKEGQDQAQAQTESICLHARRAIQ